MPSRNGHLLISADSQVAENENLRARLPEHLRERMPLLGPGTGGDLDDETNGKIRNRSSWKTLSARDRELEFCSDPSLGTDLDANPYGAQRALKGSVLYEASAR